MLQAYKASILPSVSFMLSILQYWLQTVKQVKYLK